MHKGFSIAFHPCHHPRLSSCISLWLWFAFFHRLMRMSTFSCVFDHLHIFFRELFKSSAHFKIVLSFCCWVVRVLHVRWTLDLYQTYDQRIFPVVLWVVFFSFLSLETILWHCSCLYVALSGDSQLFFCSCLGGALHQVEVAACCRTAVPDRGWSPGPLRCMCRVSVIGPPRESLFSSSASES